MTRKFALSGGLVTLIATLAMSACANQRVGELGTRLGDRPVEIVRLTNARYSDDCFWAGPRGWEYAQLPADEVRPVQIPNLYPDVQATYFVARFAIPEGARVSLSGEFPHARYLSYALQTRVGDEYLAGDGLRDTEITPNPGSTNPFAPGASRTSPARAYEVEVIPSAPPETRAPNAIYTGTEDPLAQVALALRIYVPDAGRDGTGDVGLPQIRVELGDGQVLEGEQACRVLRADVTSTPPQGFPAELWSQLVAEAGDPATAPATNPPTWERFWNAQWSTIGRFLTPQERARRFAPHDRGGYGSNPDTRYLSTVASLNVGEVLVIEGEMPTTPSTLAAPETMPDYELRYWSLCTGAAPSRGAAYDCVFDEQVALRDRRYTIVVSRPADRPRNAREACGVTWLDFGAGEGIEGPHGPGRSTVGVIYMRFMAPEPDWAHAPHLVARPGEERAIMGAAFPMSAYTSREAFEARAC